MFRPLRRSPVQVDVGVNSWALAFHGAAEAEGPVGSAPPQLLSYKHSGARAIV